MGGVGSMLTSIVELKLGLFLRSSIYSERGKFAASFYNKNSILMFFPKQSILGRGGEGGGALSSVNYYASFRSYVIYALTILYYGTS